MQRQEGSLQEKDTESAILASMKEALSTHSTSFVGLSSENRICDEMIVAIFSNLSPADLARVAKVDRKLNGIANEILAERIKSREPEALGLYSNYCSSLFKQRLDRPKRLLLRHAEQSLETAEEDLDDKKNILVNCNTGTAVPLTISLLMTILTLALGIYARDDKDVSLPSFFISAIAASLLLFFTGKNIKQHYDLNCAEKTLAAVKAQKIKLYNDIQQVEKDITDFSQNPEEKIVAIARAIQALEKLLQVTPMPNADIWDVEAGRRASSSRP